jgi:hypothetical protein
VPNTPEYGHACSRELGRSAVCGSLGRAICGWARDQREVPQLFARALRGAKAELDPAGIMNPGVLLEPAGAMTYSRDGGR